MQQKQTSFHFLYHVSQTNSSWHTPILYMMASSIGSTLPLCPLVWYPHPWQINLNALILSHIWSAQPLVTFWLMWAKFWSKMAAFCRQTLWESEKEWEIQTEFLIRIWSALPSFDSLIRALWAPSVQMQLSFLFFFSSLTEWTTCVFVLVWHPEV